MDADLVVVGGGLAGLTAANRAAEQGLCPIVLEQGSEQDYRCNSRMTGGAFHMAMGAVDRDPAEVLQALQAAQLEDVDVALVLAVAGRGRQVIDWLRAQGIKFIRGGPMAWQQWVLAPPNIPRPSYDWHGRGGDVCLRTLEEKLISRGGLLMRGMRARQLVINDGAIAGIRSEDSMGNIVQYSCRSVILADGGYQGNADLVTEFISRHADKLIKRGAGTGMGDGVGMVREAGGMIARTRNFYGHLLAYEAARNARLNPFPFIDYLALAGVLVNHRGERIADEGRGGIYLANCLAATEDPSDAYVIFDTEIWEGPGRTANNPVNPYLSTEASGLVQAGGLQELARTLGIDAKNLQQTIELHNRAASDSGVALSPPRSTTKAKPMPLRTAPYYGIRVCPGLTYTMGGIKVDAACAVVSVGSEKLGGLFAAGTTVGGLEGGRYVGYVGGLARSAATGFIAAESAAAYLKQKQANHTTAGTSA